MDSELMCNVRKCHKKLETFAWVRQNVKRLLLFSKVFKFRDAML